MQLVQNLCPHLVSIGALKVSRQIGHSVCETIGTNA